MPNTPSVIAPRFFADAISEPLLALHLYGAAGIAAVGWAFGRLLGWETAPYLGMWYCAALLIYNADRLRPDPADVFNIPQRAATSLRYRFAGILVVSAAAMFLVASPLARGDYLTLACVLGGSVVCLGYSFPIFRIRLKEVPLLKSFFAPTIVIITVVALPLLGGERPMPAAHFAGTIAYFWTLLMFNMLLCDLRDLAGDQRTGIVSVPVRLGEMGTRRLLLALLVGNAAIALGMSLLASAHLVSTWRLLSLLAPIYLGVLLAVANRRPPESFYEWWVEGILFVPAVSVVLTMQDSLR